MSDAVPIVAVVLGCINILIGVGTLFTFGRAWGRLETETRHTREDLAKTDSWLGEVARESAENSKKVARLEGAQEASA